MSSGGLKFEIESKTVADFRKLNKSGDLVLRPEYQRKVVWPHRAKVSLMETILLGYPIPEIYLAFETSPDGDETTSVVDGQQRLTALLDFLENKYALDDLEDQELTKKFEGLKFRDLPESVRQEFFGYRFPIRRLSNLADEFVRAVFARVNRVNMVLTEQEMRNALLPGPFNDFLKDCAAHSISSKSGVFSANRKNRGGDLEFFAEVFGTCIFGLSNKKVDLDERYDEISKNFDDYQQDADNFIQVLDVLSEVIKWTGRTRWSNIVDLFTLLSVSWEMRGSILDPASGKSDHLWRVLDSFQRAVSSHKRNGEIAGQDESVAGLSLLLDLPNRDVAELVEGYTSGIRNSSDLKSRRVRSQKLNTVMERALGVR